MERLTIPDKPIEGGMRRAMIDTRAVREEAMKIYWALKKYEDTGFTPAEILDGKMLIDWIPVEERLPTTEMPVYATVEYHGGDRRVQEAFWKDGDFVDLNGWCSLSKIIKAWQPRWVPMPYDPID